MHIGTQGNCLIWIFRGSVAYVITSSHFDNIDSSEETNAFRSSEPNRNDCWCLVPPPCPDWFKLSHIQPINIGFWSTLLNHCLARFFGNLSKRKVKVKCVVRAWKQTHNNTFAWEHSLKKPRKTQDRALWHKTNQKQGWKSGTSDKALEFRYSCC